MNLSRRGFASAASRLMAVGVVAGSGVAATQAVVQAEEKPTEDGAEPKGVDRKALEKKLAAQLSGSVFHGVFTVDGKEGKAPSPEKYTITKATKLAEDYWQLETRIQYGGNDTTIPITLEIKWAGDTPVITLTELMIPKLGTFSSRVVIHGDRYAGTWQHDQVGGHLYGKIERAKE